MMRTKWIFVVFLLLQCGCFRGKFISKVDRFTGTTTKDGRVGTISNSFHTFYLHAHAVNNRKTMLVYVGFQAPITVEQLDLLADGKRINLRCWFVKEGTKSYVFEYRQFSCDLDHKQAALLAQSQSLTFRILKTEGISTKKEMTRLAQVLK